MLFISSGSNLVSWFGKMSAETPRSINSIIRPTLALIRIHMKSCDSMSYELSRIVADLPRDVYVIHNPFQHTHLRTLQRVLYSLRREILMIQHRDVRDKEMEGEKHGAGQKHKDETQQGEDRDPASTFCAIQCETDLYANRFLRRLQKRVDFHVMWIDASTNNVLCSKE